MILITGASGNVGKEVLKQVAQAGVRVRAAFQSVGKAATALESNAAPRSIQRSVSPLRAIHRLLGSG